MYKSATLLATTEGHVCWIATKTGNGHVRRLLIEEDWIYRHLARKSKLIQRRAERTPQWATVGESSKFLVGLQQRNGPRT